MKSIKLTFQNKSIFTILFTCILLTVLQANGIFFSGSNLRTSLCGIVLFFYLVLIVILYLKKNLFSNRYYVIFLGGVLLRFLYVLFTGVYDRQHDEGAFTAFSDTFVNPGHLGYIEYLCKHHHLPDFDPYQLFSYFHPPLHHILATLFIEINLFFGVSWEFAFENIQVLTFAYSCLSLLVGLKILKLLFPDNAVLTTGFLFLAIHPGMIFLSGSVNNDMLATLFSFLCIYATLLWLKEKSQKNLLLIALFLGLSMIIKLNTAILALPIGLLLFMNMITCYRSKKLLYCVKQYLLFLLIVAPVGLSWISRNLILFHQKPGIPSATVDSFMYYGNQSLWHILGIPSNLSLDYPFHTLYGKENCNAWLILIRTSLFAEMRPATLNNFFLILCQIIMILALVLVCLFFFMTLISLCQKIRQGNKEIGIFLLSTYLTILITYIVFVLKYPYTCSCDFRYVTTAILFTPIALCAFAQTSGKKYNKLLKISIWLINIFCILTTTVLLFWNQW